LVSRFLISRVRTEIQDSLIFKSDDKTLQHLDKLKESNQDIQNIIGWLEEYSAGHNNKDIYNNIKKKSEQRLTTINTNFRDKDYMSNDYLMTNQSIMSEYDSFYNTSGKNNILTNNMLDLGNQNNFSSIDSPEFNIFLFDDQVGKENTLSMISCYVFLNLGLYSIIQYEHFENFLELIYKGYSRNNPYHNDLHAADVEQTCYMYQRYGYMKEVY
jgi:hypothetical protein